TLRPPSRLHRRDRRIQQSKRAARLERQPANYLASCPIDSYCSLFSTDCLRTVARSQSTINIAIDSFRDEVHRSIRHHKLCPARMPTLKTTRPLPLGRHRDESFCIRKNKMIERNPARCPGAVGEECRRPIILINHVFAYHKSRVSA